MIATVLGPAVQKNIGGKLPQDDISRLRGNQDGFTYCGERKFEITSATTADFLSYNNDLTTLTLLSTKDSEIGEKISVTIKASLVDFAVDVTKTSTFFVSVRSCVVLTLTATQTPNQSYTMEVPAVVKTITVNAFKQGPECSSAISYAIQIVNKISGALESLPSWIT